MKPELLIMAAGMGSRYGGLKQAAGVGPNGEMIIDYSVYDAVKAGFGKAVIIIRREIEDEFRSACGKRIEKLIDTEYVYQEKDALPEGFTAPGDRTKPWGTGHAVLCAKDVIKNPFMVINADDYYGQSIYKTMCDYLKSGEGMCMAGYKLYNTLSENGTVARGVCEVKDGYLKDIVENTGISKDSGFAEDTIVSMNMWGLDTDVFAFLEKEFKAFLEENISDLKSEFFLPSVINKRMTVENKPVRVIDTTEKWYGVTYREDAPAVQKAMAEKIASGLYE